MYYSFFFSCFQASLCLQRQNRNKLQKESPTRNDRKISRRTNKQQLSWRRWHHCNAKLPGSSKSYRRSKTEWRKKQWFILILRIHRDEKWLSSTPPRTTGDTTHSTLTLHDNIRPRLPNLPWVCAVCERSGDAMFTSGQLRLCGENWHPLAASVWPMCSLWHPVWCHS